MSLVNNIVEFVRHINLHRARLYRVGTVYWGADSVVNPYYLRVALWVHDLEKYIFLPWLWKYYGAKGKKYKRSDAIKLYTLMNRVGAVIRKVALLPFKEDKYIDNLEHIIDVVDRHLDPVALEEFNLEVQRPITDFLTGIDYLEAQALIKVWKESTKDLQYGSQAT